MENCAAHNIILAKCGLEFLNFQFRNSSPPLLFYFTIFFVNSLHRKSIGSVWLKIELSVHFSPAFANTFSLADSVFEQNVKKKNDEKRQT